MCAHAHALWTLPVQRRATASVGLQLAFTTLLRFSHPPLEVWSLRELSHDPPQLPETCSVTEWLSIAPAILTHSGNHRGTQSHCEVGARSDGVSVKDC